MLERMVRREESMEDLRDGRSIPERRAWSRDPDSLDSPVWLEALLLQLGAPEDIWKDMAGVFRRLWTGDERGGQDRCVGISTDTSSR